jgi:hypothetical protein
LNAKYQFEIEEIAHLQNKTIEEVKKLFKDAQKALRLSFLNRFDIDE